MSDYMSIILNEFNRKINCFKHILFQIHFAELQNYFPGILNTS